MNLLSFLFNQGDLDYRRGYRQGIEDARASIEHNFPNLLRKSVSNINAEMLKRKWGTSVEIDPSDTLAISFRILVQHGVCK